MGRTNQSVEPLLRVLEGHPGLTALDLRGNHLTALAGKGLLRLAKVNPRVLHIETTGVGGGVELCLACCFERLNWLSSLWMGRVWRVWV